MSPMKPMEPLKAPERWWPEELGETPNSTGGQDETRYSSSAIRSAWPSILVTEKFWFITPVTVASPTCSNTKAAAAESRCSSQRGEVDLATLKEV
jgi:hypothetical protein